MSLEKVHSADGTSIAFDRLGRGRPLVLLAGGMCDRRTFTELADVLAADFEVFNVDRRGRGDSGDTAPYAVGREIEDIAAVIQAAGANPVLDIVIRQLRAAGTPPVCVESARIRHGLSETVASDDPELRAWIAETVAADREAFLAKHPDAQLTRVGM